MSTTLSYGFIKPATGDLGTVFFPALENNIQYLNDHTHNGTNSARLTAAASSVVTQGITSTSWTSVSGAVCRKLVTLSSLISSVGGTTSTVGMQFREANSGLIANLEYTIVSSTTYYLYCNMYDGAGGCLTSFTAIYTT